MMDTKPLADYLRTQLVDVREVGAAADFMAAADGSVSVPAVFVIPQEERVAEDDFDGEFLLRVVIAVVCVVSNYRDSIGEAAQSDLEKLRCAVKDAIDEFIPAGAQAPARFMRGGLMSFDAQTMWWADEFEVLLSQ
ncbi:hypothetical protein [Azonexus sp.]|uniref:phage tail terminator protein n=1 Tax=Azonexus sp. TaxID=1872668 RepID=UPI0027BA741E|nr:hypothetical protein [Azonexus sp.]